MAVITIGSAAENRSNFIASTYTIVSDNGSANGTGTINTYSVYVATNTESVELTVGTMSMSGTSGTPRDYANVGAPSAGLNTYEDLSIDVVLGDYPAWYSAGSGTSKGVCLDRTAAGAGGGGYYYKAGNQWAAGTQTYTDSGDDIIISIYGTGETAATGQPFIKRFGGVPYAALNRGVW